MKKTTDSYSKSRARAELLLKTTGQMGKSIVQAAGQRKSKNFGINLVASKYLHSGIGQYAAVIERVAEASGRVVHRFPFDGNGEFNCVTRELCDDTVAIVSPGQLPFAQLMHPRAFLSRHRRAAIIFWDVDKVPKRMGVGFKLLDELWAPSSSGATVLAEQFDIPVRVFPTPILSLAGGSRGSLRRAIGIKDEFLIAYQFDMGSSAMRKNPWDAVSSYRQAFPNENDGAHLLLKCSRGVEASADYKRLQELCDSRRDITLANEYWDDDLVASMYLDIDCYLSTHRSEGYGLTVAQALAADKYVIATGYGATTDFMPSCFTDLIPYKLVKVGKNPIYPHDAKWAEPNVEATADLLRRAFDDPVGTAAKGIQAGQHAKKEFSIDRAVATFNELLGGATAYRPIA